MFRLFSLFIFIAAFLPQQSFAATRTLMSGKTGTGVTSTQSLPTGLPIRQFQAFGTTSVSTGACAVEVDVSNDATNWLVLGTISLTLGTSATNDGFVSNGSWPYVRGNVTSISGTGAACSLTVGY